MQKVYLYAKLDKTMPLKIVRPKTEDRSCFRLPTSAFRLFIDVQPFPVFSIIVFFLLLFYKPYAQEIAVGEWNVHIPYDNAIAVAESDNRIYCASESALFYYDLNDNSLTTLSKASGLSDAGISTIAYSKEYEILVIAYSNGNIDLIENDKIINLSDIKRKSMTGTKNIHHIMFMGNEAWMACSFGIAVLDIATKNFVGNWTIGANGSNVEIKDLTFDGQYIYASTVDSGVYLADINSSNIQDYNNWSKMSGLPNGTYNSVCYFANKLYANYSTATNNADTLYEFDGTTWGYATSLEGMDSSKTDRRPRMWQTNNKLVISSYYYVSVYDDSGNTVLTSASYGSGKDVRDGLYDRSGYIWLADNGYGLVKSGPYGGTEVIAPSGPKTTNVFDISISNNVLWAAPGGVTPSWSNSWIKDGIFFYKESEWDYLSEETIDALDTINDYLTVEIDPANPDHAFVGTWDDGVLEFTSTGFTTSYSHHNSSLQYPSSQNCASFCRTQISDLAFDTNNNLWVANPGADEPLSVKLSNGDWYGFSCNNTISTDKIINGMVVDPYGQKWASIEGGGVLVFDENGTYDDEADDLATILNTSVGNGGLHTNSVTCVVMDLEDAIWIGTNEGPTVISFPGLVFSGDDFDADRPTSWYDGHLENLLQNEYVTDIAVDGANRKWIGTETSGAYLIAPDETGQGDYVQIEHFDESNSPLLSNNIRTIAINHETGEVFFGTDKGIVSYKGTATEGTETYDEILVYPNPVRENFTGTIAIRGLVESSDVQITDISGNLVFQTIAEGGQANWDGKNFKGEKAQTGIYLVFCNSPDGSEKKVTKIAFIN